MNCKNKFPQFMKIIDSAKLNSFQSKNFPPLRYINPNNMWHSKSFTFLSIYRSLVIFSNSQILKTLSISNFSQAIPISPLSPVLFYRKITYHIKILVCVVMVIQSRNSLNEKQVLKRLQELVHSQENNFHTKKTYIDMIAKK